MTHTPTIRRAEKAALLTTLGLMVTAFLLPACPKPPPPKTSQPTTTRSEKFPWVLWSRRVDKPMMVVLATRRRLLAVEYDQVPLSPKAKPIGLAGLAPDTGEVLWHRDMTLKLTDPTQPWSVQIARKDRVLAVWQADGSLMGIDLYTGKDFWDKPRKDSLGVSALGFGFVTLWQDKLYFLKPETGKTDKVFSLPAVATWPAQVSEEGQLFVLCGDLLAEMDVNTGKVAWSKKLALADLMPPARLDLIQDRLAVSYQTLERVDTTSVIRLDSKTLKRKWMAATPGRVRTHDAVVAHDDRGFVLIEDAFGAQHWVPVDLAKGKVGRTTDPRKLSRCTFGNKLMFCPYKNKNGTGIEAIDLATWKKQWTWETISDVSGRQHFFYKGRFFLAGDAKVIGLNQAGTTVFKAKVVWPGTSLQVNRILGLVKGTLIITAVDWSQAGGIGELWGIDANSGTRKWRKRLTNALSTTDSVALVGKKLFYLDNKGIQVLRANNGRMSDRWPNRLPGKATRPPRIHVTCSYAYAIRGNRVAVYRTSDARPLWTMQLPAATRLLGDAAGTLVARKPDGSIQAWDLKTGKTTWSIPWADPAAPIPATVKGNQLLLAGPRGSVILDPATGKKKGDWMAARHVLPLPGGDLLVVSVTRRIPKNGQILKVFGVTRRADGVKLVELWHKGFARTPGKPSGMTWMQILADQVLYRDAADGCLHALGGDDGSEAWKLCGPMATMPPVRYRASLYLTSGQMDPKKPRAEQGLFSLDPDSGKTKLVFKFPGRSTSPDRFMLAPVGPVTQGVIYLLTDGLRLRAVKVAK